MYIVFNTFTSYTHHLTPINKESHTAPDSLFFLLSIVQSPCKSIHCCRTYDTVPGNINIRKINIAAWRFREFWWLDILSVSDTTPHPPPHPHPPPPTHPPTHPHHPPTPPPPTPHPTPTPPPPPPPTHPPTPPPHPPTPSACSWCQWS